jgi:hypothetical protein
MVSHKIFPDLNLSRVVHNYVVERGWSGANEHYNRIVICNLYPLCCSCCSCCWIVTHGIRSTNWYLKYQLVFEAPIGI